MPTLAFKPKARKRRSPGEIVQSLMKGHPPAGDGLAFHRSNTTEEETQIAARRLRKELLAD